MADNKSFIHIDLPIGEELHTDEGIIKAYEAKDESCEDCAFNCTYKKGDFGNVDLCYLMLCQRVHRKDKKDVVFDLVKE